MEVETPGFRKAQMERLERTFDDTILAIANRDSEKALQRLCAHLSGLLTAIAEQNGHDSKMTITVNNAADGGRAITLHAVAEDGK